MKFTHGSIKEIVYRRIRVSAGLVPTSKFGVDQEDDNFVLSEFSIAQPAGQIGHPQVRGDVLVRPNNDDDWRPWFRAPAQSMIDSQWLGQAKTQFEKPLKEFAASTTRAQEAILSFYDATGDMSIRMLETLKAIQSAAAVLGAAVADANVSMPHPIGLRYGGAFVVEHRTAPTDSDPLGEILDEGLRFDLGGMLYAPVECRVADECAICDRRRAARAANTAK